MSQANNKKVNLIAIMAVMATLIVGIPGFRIFFVEDNEEQKPVIINDYSRKNNIPPNPPTGDTIFSKVKNTKNNKESNSQITTPEENRAKPQKLNEDQDDTVSNDQAAKNISFNLSGHWSLTIKADWFISSKHSQKMGRPNIGGLIKLSQTGNSIQGSFTARN